MKCVHRTQRPPHIYAGHRMHRSNAGHNPYNLFILTNVYCKNLTTRLLLTIECMAMFVVESVQIQINGQVMDLSIDI